MSEEVQTEEKGGSVLIPAALGVAGVVGARHLYNKGANTLADAALNHGYLAEGVKAAPDALVKAAQEAAPNGSLIRKNFISAKKLQAESAIGKIETATFTKAAGEGAKGFTAEFHTGNGSTILTGIEKLPDDVAKAMGENASHSLEGDALKALTKDGEKSWVAKTAQTAEKDVLKALRGAEAYKKEAGILKTLGHIGTGGKLAIGAAAVAAVGGLGYAISNMFSSGPSHAERVEAGRSEEAAAGRA